MSEDSGIDDGILSGVAATPMACQRGPFQLATMCRIGPHQRTCARRSMHRIRRSACRGSLFWFALYLPNRLSRHVSPCRHSRFRLCAVDVCTDTRAVHNCYCSMNSEWRSAWGHPQPSRGLPLNSEVTKACARSCTNSLKVCSLQLNGQKADPCHKHA